MRAPAHIPDRYELKYVIPESMCAPLRAALRPYCELDRFSAATDDKQYCITSLYYDTPTLLFHRTKQAKQLRRFKLRVRTYGIESDGPVFFEVKRKIGDIVAKARARVPRADWSARLRPQTDDGVGAAERDFTSLLSRHDARPTLLARYHREAWVSTIDNYARVTFDRRLLYQPFHRHDLRGDSRCWRSSDDAMTTRGTSRGVVLELKSTVDVPRWMVALIRRFDLARVGFSKYCSGVERVLRESGSASADRVATCA
jgi:SPX domain protein involved in polyphosphate accumulation